MSKQQRYASADKGEFSDSDTDYNESSEETEQGILDYTRLSRQNKSKDEDAGLKKVKCKQCLKGNHQLRSLKKHVSKAHSEFFKENKKQPRSFFVA